MSTSALARARIPSRVRLLVLAAAAILLLAGGAIAARDARAAVPPTPPGWGLVWADDFNGATGSGVNTTNWRYTTGTSYPGGPTNFGTGEIETMTSSTTNVSLDGAGNLRITPVRDGAGNWTSGRIETNRTDFQATAGGKLRVEARIQLPNVTGAAARGYWPAFWMLGDAYRGNWWNWPGVGEMDIMENVQGLNRAWGVFHCGTSPGGPCNEKNGIAGTRDCSPSSCQTAFHTYRLEWDRSTSPEELRWYLDGVHFHTVRANQMDPGTWANATHHGFFIILNVAMGGEFPAALGGGPDGATASGRPMVVDYVAVWRSGGGDPSPTPTSTGTPSPTPTGPPGNRDAYGTIQAESYDQQGGLAVEATSDGGGGQNIGSIANGDWALYRGVNFGSSAATQFYGRVASGAPGGVSGLVEVRLDSRSSPPIGSFAIANTGGWQSWRTVPANISGVTGTHDVYLTFTSGQPAEYVNVNWISFGH